jgi:DNA-binding response OmpR family regulator
MGRVTGNRLRTRVLVVEDERHIARFLEFALKKAEYEVAVVYNCHRIDWDVPRRYTPTAHSPT